MYLARIFSHFDVLYGVDFEGQSIPEIQGGNRDLNSGHKGNFVYLKAVMQDIDTNLYSNPARALQRIQYIGIERRGTGDPSRADLAKGAGGDFRLLSYRYAFSGPAIHDVALWRSSGRQCIPPDGWTGMSCDINEGRGGDYLYIIWKADTPSITVQAEHTFQIEADREV